MSNHSFPYPRVRARIHLDRLRSNARLVMARAAAAEEVLAVVKCDAYGHGAAQVSKVLLEEGVGMLAVSGLDEAQALRAQGVDAPILVMDETPTELAQEAVALNLATAVADIGLAQALDRAAGHLGATARVHLMVDTGMGRFGVEPDEAPAALAALRELANLEVEGVFSHLGATFRTDPDSNASTLRQIGLFQDVLARMAQDGPLPRLRHLASSTGFLGFPGQALEGGINALRLGTLFLGYSERPPAWDKPPAPVAEATTTVLAVRDLPKGRKVGYDGLFATTADTRLAVLACGYAHGLHRDLGNQGAALVNGSMAPIVGKPALNHIVLDVTGLADVAPGTEVTLAGRDHPVYEQGRRVGRGVWEMLLPLLSRAHRTWTE